MIQCSQCNYENKDDAQFCLNCGAPLSSVANEDGYDDVSDEATVLINPAAMQARINSEMKSQEASKSGSSSGAQPVPQIQKASKPAPQAPAQQQPEKQILPPQQQLPPANQPQHAPQANASNSTTIILLGVVIVLVIIIIGMLISNFIS